MSEDLTKTFPYFVIWFDQGPLSCEGTTHCRSEEEAWKMAEVRVLFGSFKSHATVYKGNSSGQAKMIYSYKWDIERKVIVSFKRV